MLVKIVNIVSYCLCRFTILFIVRPEVKIDPAVLTYRKKRDEGLVMISNHKLLLDSWIICASLPAKTFFSLMPVRIMGALDFADPVANTLQKLGVVKIIYYLYGVLGFHKEWTLEQKLGPFVSCLKSKGTILVFPEGRLVHESGVAPFKQGIVRIYQQAPSDILPFAVNKEKNKIKVAIGAPLRLPTSILTSEDPTDPFPTKSCEFLRQLVKKLYGKEDNLIKLN